LRRFSRNALVLFMAVSALSMTIIHLMTDGDDLPFVRGTMEARYIVSISLYNGLSVAGFFVLLKYTSRETAFYQRMGQMVAIFFACVIMRAPLFGTWPTLTELASTMLWETARAVGVAFAVAYIAHTIYSRYFPSTLLRVRDVTPVLVDGLPAVKSRRSHARTAQWLFDMRDRKYLDSTKLRMETDPGPSFDWPSWGEATFWSSVLLLSFSIYGEVYPRVSDSFDVVLTSVMAGHLLTLIPLLLLPSYPVDRLGAEIPVEGTKFHLANGFRHTAFRWTKLSFIPIIVIALLVRFDLVEQDWASLADALLIAVPTAAMINLVYLECFRNRTVAEIHRAIIDWEKKELEEWGHEPWREVSLLDDVDVIELDLEVK
jgi:hypothetical protein